MINGLELITLRYDKHRIVFTFLITPLIIKEHFSVMIHDIVINIWEYHVCDQECLVIFNNLIGKGLTIDLEPMAMIICVVYGVCTFSPPLSPVGYGGLNLNKVGGILLITL